MNGKLGLSPRVRGNHKPRAFGFFPLGSIPACAGEPRLFLAGPLAVPGLSPRVRGNPPRRRAKMDTPRSIPACAGEPVHRGTALRGPWVYPRVCGGTNQQSVTKVPNKGLSPRVRGNHSRPTEAAIVRGSIPACAGEPVSASGMRFVPGVYPRVCGGTWTTPSDSMASRGLSPRVRGNPECGLLDDLGARVYPRVCGGTEKSQTSPDRYWGLSPRVRGNPVRAAEHGGGDGSIPACAGEPQSEGGSVEHCRVYPRVCGGTSSTRSL